MLDITVLSLEHNFIDTLDSFSQLQHLRELHLAHNLVEELRSILSLKSCSQLKILDLSFNPLSSPEKAYRNYLIWHLTLQVLDGVLIEEEEGLLAKEEFFGRLTMEILEEKLGPFPACFYVNFPTLKPSLPRLQITPIANV